MEIVEHVQDLNLFIKSSSELLKKNGIMFVATINKTIKSYLLAIIGAEYILNWLPVGTHDWLKFVEPKKLDQICKNNHLKSLGSSGLIYNIILDTWKLSDNTDVNYISRFKKNLIFFIINPGNYSCINSFIFEFFNFFRGSFTINALFIFIFFIMY